MTEAIMERIIILILFIAKIVCDDTLYKTVELDEGLVRGEKYWNGFFYEFFEIPYATVPKGRDRFKGPLPPQPWKGILNATQKSTLCPQTFYSGEEDEEIVGVGEEECLLMNLFVPGIASKENLVPVVVYLHSGAYAGGNGNMAKYNYLARHDVLVVSFNYRLGAIGFNCLGTKEIPGNAGMKDQVAALRWINKNIIKFGGDPKKVTIAGFSVGAAMAELLLLSKSTKGLIDKIILESGSALSPFAINNDPISTAKNIAISLGYNGTGTLEDLTEFYINTPALELALKSRNFFLTNSTFGFSPCIENVYEDIEPFLTESPFDILNKGDYLQVPILTGFANNEGLSRALNFDKWLDMMNEKFEDFLPADLTFNDTKSKEKVVKDIQKYYFNDEEVSYDNLQSFIDYFSDSMFKYSILKSAQMHARHTNRPIYFYEFQYFGELSMKHLFMDRIKGASHRDQTAYVLDFYGWTNKYEDLDMRDKMTLFWSDFVKFGNPTEYECDLINYQWPKYTLEEKYYLEINTNDHIKTEVLKESYEFWDKIYSKHYLNPTSPLVSKNKKLKYN